MLIRKPFLSEIGIYSLKINDIQEEDYEIVKITHIGFVDEYGIEGLLLLKADDGKEFHMHAFQVKWLGTYLAFILTTNLFLLFTRCLKKFVKKMKYSLLK